MVDVSSALLHLLNSRVKADDAPAAADSHFCAAVVILADLSPVENLSPEQAEALAHARVVSGGDQWLTT